MADIVIQKVDTRSVEQPLGSNVTICEARVDRIYLGQLAQNATQGATIDVACSIQFPKGEPHNSWLPTKPWEEGTQLEVALRWVSKDLQPNSDYYTPYPMQVDLKNRTVVSPRSPGSGPITFEKYDEIYALGMQWQRPRVNYNPTLLKATNSEPLATIALGGPTETLSIPGGLLPGLEAQELAVTLCSANVVDPLVGDLSKIAPDGTLTIVCAVNPQLGDTFVPQKPKPEGTQLVAALSRVAYQQHVAYLPWEMTDDREAGTLSLEWGGSNDSPVSIDQYRAEYEKSLTAKQ